MEDALAISPPSTAQDHPQCQSVHEHTQCEAPDTPLPRHGEHVRASHRQNYNAQQPSRVQNNPPDQLSAQEVTNLRVLLDKYKGTHDWADSLSDKIDSLLNSVGIIEDNVCDLYKTTCPLSYANHSYPCNCNSLCLLHGAHCHHLYPGTGHTLPGAVRPARHVDSLQAAPPQGPAQDTVQNTMIAQALAATKGTVAREESLGTSMASSTLPTVLPALAITRSSGAPAGPNQAQST